MGKDEDITGIAIEFISLACLVRSFDPIRRYLVGFSPPDIVHPLVCPLAHVNPVEGNHGSRYHPTISDSLNLRVCGERSSRRLIETKLTTDIMKMQAKTRLERIHQEQ